MTLKYRGNSKKEKKIKCRKCNHSISLSDCDSYKVNGRVIILCPNCEEEN